MVVEDGPPVVDGGTLVGGGVVVVVDRGVVVVAEGKVVEGGSAVVEEGVLFDGGDPPVIRFLMARSYRLLPLRCEIGDSHQVYFTHRRLRRRPKA